MNAIHFGGLPTVAGTLSILLVAALVSSCGSSRTSIEGYSDKDLNDTRLFVLHPAKDDLKIEDPHAFAWSRGIGDMGASGRLDTELRSLLIEELDAAYDSNLVFDYATHTVGAVYPLDVARDFGPELGLLHWDDVKRAHAEHAVDYLLVLSAVSVKTWMPDEGKLKGDEATTLRYGLLDPSRERVMTSGEITVETNDPDTMRTHYRKIARSLARRLPFLVGDE